MWTGNLYCIHLEINQIQFGNIMGDINQVEEIEINIDFDQLYQSRGKFLPDEKLESYSGIISNYQYALDYIEEKSQIEFPDTTSKWIDFNKKYIKIKTATNEIFRIYYEDLKSYIPSFNDIVMLSFLSFE